MPRFLPSLKYHQTKGNKFFYNAIEMHSHGGLSFECFLLKKIPVNIPMLLAVAII